MLRAYLDESGHTGGPVCVIAGFIGTDEQWRSFERDWKAGLTISQRRHLHMSDLNWNRPITRRLLAQLGPIPHEHNLIPVLGIVPRGLYDKLVMPTFKIVPVKPWILAFRKVFLAIAQGIASGETVNIIFELQEEYRPFVDMVYEMIRHHNEQLGQDRLLGINFVPKESAYGTEAADYLAFQYREFLTDRNSKKAQWGLSIMGDDSGVGGIYDEQELQKYVRDAATNYVIRRAKRL
jgi:hypothetical protein